MADDNAKFFKNINESETGQLLGLAANASGTLGAAFAAYGLLNQVFNPTPSDTEKILAAIDQLRQIIDSDFVKLGDLIKQQIQLVIQNEDTLELTNRLAMASTALDKLARFLRTREAGDLRDADTWSDMSIQFFMNLPPPGSASVASRTDPFFLPGVIKAGTVRILVIATQDLNFRTIKEDVDQIANISNLLRGMIDRVKAQVNMAHTVREERQADNPNEPGLPVVKPGRPTIKGYYHNEHGKDLAFFDANESKFADDPEAVAARAQAKRARDLGVSAELNRSTS